MDIAMKGYPDVKINEGTLEFTPAYVALSGYKSDCRREERF